MTRSHDQLTGARTGFSLVEMLMVIAIIALLISLLLPVLSNARNSAFQVRTAAMSADISNAAQRFGNDNNGRNPGYFSEAQMGSSSNWDSVGIPLVGMSAMENAMLELGGTGVVLGRESDSAVAGLMNLDKGIISVGPTTDINGRVVVNINMIGAQGAYYTPEAKFFKAQVHGQPEREQAGNRANVAGNGQMLMPDVLDGWGRPLLVWAQDPMARGQILVEPGAAGIDVYEQFVQVDSDAGPAWFYLASNAAFLEAYGFDNGNINMNADPADGTTSVIGGGVEDLERLKTLATALASPGSFIVDPAQTGLESASFEEVFPSRPRSRFIVHSAGSDGIFLSSGDAGWGSNGHTDGAEFHLDFGNNYITQGGDRITDDKGAFSNIDMMDDFDDLFVGN